MHERTPEASVARKEPPFFVHLILRKIEYSLAPKLNLQGDAEDHVREVLCYVLLTNALEEVAF